MRDIKFRCWNNLIQRMHDPATLNELLNEAWDIGHADSQERNGDEYDHLTWLQYTGLKDKNGKEIYEGDIIGRTTLPDKVIIWFEHGFGYYRINNNERYSAKYLDQFDVVIGNIYESPELLSKEQEVKATESKDVLNKRFLD